MALNQKNLVDELRSEWKKLWSERLDDKVKAEGIASSNYEKLFVDKGTVIHATRNYKPLEFTEILKQNKVPAKYEPTNPTVGGWNKFVKTQIKTQKQKIAFKPEIKAEPNQPKKGGRGWLHK